MDVADLVLELFEDTGLLEVGFSGLKEVFESILIFLLIFFILFGTWELLYEENINDLYKFVLDELIVENIQYLWWN